MRIYMSYSRGKVEGRGYSEHCDVNVRTRLKKAYIQSIAKLKSNLCSGITR